MKRLFKTMLLSALLVLLLCGTAGCSHALVSNSLDKEITPSSDYRIDTPAKSTSFVVRSPAGIPSAPECPLPSMPVESKEIWKIKKLADRRVVVQVIVTEDK